MGFLYQLLLDGTHEVNRFVVVTPLLLTIVVRNPVPKTEIDLLAVKRKVLYSFFQEAVECSFIASISQEVGTKIGRNHGVFIEKTSPCATRCLSAAFDRIFKIAVADNVDTFILLTCNQNDA